MLAWKLIEKMRPSLAFLFLAVAWPQSGQAYSSRATQSRSESWVTVQPDRASLKYPQGASATFVVFPGTQPTNPDFQLVLDASFPTPSSAASLTRLGDLFLFTTQPLSAGISIFTVRVCWQNQSLASADEALISDIETKIAALQSQLAQTADPAVIALDQAQLQKLQAADQAIRAQLAETKRCVQDISEVITAKAPPVIAVTSPAPGQIVTAHGLNVTGTVSDPTAQVTVNGVQAATSPNATGLQFSVSIATPNDGKIVVQATDDVGNVSSQELSVVDDFVAPVVSVSSPTVGQKVSTAFVAVSGGVTSLLPVGVLVNGSAAAVSGAAPNFQYSVLVPSPASGVILVQATDAGGLSGSFSQTIQFVNSIVISAPSPHQVVNTPQIEVTGVETDLSAIITVNGQTAQTLAGPQGLGFSATIPTPTDGKILVRAQDGAGITTQEVDVSSGSTAPITQLSVGRFGSCVLVGDAMKCWGFGANPTSGPEAVPGLESGVSFISSGFNAHSCAVKSGSAYCWGQNNVGQVGNGAEGSTPVAQPSQVVGLAAGVTAISAGEDHTCAVVSGGVQCWGGNDWGQLGIGPSPLQVDVPTPVSGLGSGVVAITAGQFISCALMQDQSVKCWGNGLSSTPQAVPALSSGVSAISSGLMDYCAILTGGDMQCFGSPSFGQLGSPSGGQVTGLTAGVSAMSAGWLATCAIVSGGVQCWGHNDQGQLGNGSNVDSSAPVQVTGLTAGATAVSVGDGSACAQVNSSIYCWGRNDAGQLGNGTYTPSAVPVRVLGL